MTQSFTIPVCTDVSRSGFPLQPFFLLQLTFMGLNHLEVEEDGAAGGASGGCLPSNAWHKVGEEAELHFRRAPTFHFM